MKHLIKLFTLFLLAGLIASCNHDGGDDFITKNAKTGGLLDIKTPSVNYALGSAPTDEYKAKFTVYQGEKKTNTVNIYKKFFKRTDKKDKKGNIIWLTSNKELFKTIKIENQESFVKEYKMTFGELVEGLTIEGKALPKNDADYQIGEYWELTYETISSEGTALNVAKTKVTVATKLAGNYRVLDGSYYRINVLTDNNWTGDVRIIESVDPTTYNHIGIGPFDADFTDPSWTLDLKFTHANPTAETISYPDGQTVLSGNSVVSCETNPSAFVNVSCADGNKVILDDVTGKHKIIMVYGYDASGGYREFYEVLEKIVE